MASALLSLLLVSSTAAWNIVSRGGDAGRVKQSKPQVSIPALPNDKLADVFRLHDVDGNGYLEEHELKAAFIASGHPATDDTIKHSMSLLDANHDGRISLDEFLAMRSQNAMTSLARVFMHDNGHVFEENGDAEFSSGQYRRDKKLFSSDPARYCADRCLSTGYCEVIEDIYEMTTQQVKQFCEHCAGQEECELSYA